MSQSLDSNPQCGILLGQGQNDERETTIVTMWVFSRNTERRCTSLALRVDSLVVLQRKGVMDLSLSAALKWLLIQG